jgi:hypothetical protein
MSITNHYNNSFSDSNIISIDSNSSLNDNMKYIKVYEGDFNYIKNEIIDSNFYNDDHNNDEDNLSQFSGFSYITDFEDYDKDKLEENLGCKTFSDLDSDFDFMFDYDIIYNPEHNNKTDTNYLSEIKNKIMNKVKLNKTELLHIQYADETTKFEIIKLFNFHS